MTTHMTTCSIRLAIVHLRHPIKRSGYQRFNPAPCKAACSPRLLREEGGDPSKGLVGLGIEDMKDRADQQRVAGLLPVVALL